MRPKLTQAEVRMEATRDVVRQCNPVLTSTGERQAEPPLRLDGPALEDAPWVCSWLARMLRAVPTTQALDAFDIPYVAFALQTSAAHASASAVPLLNAGRTDELWRHLVRVATSAGIADGAAPARLIVPNGHYALSIRSVKGPAGRITVVVLRPTPRGEAAATPDVHGLTMRQAEIARLIAAGESTKRIASRLAISEHTVRHHTEHLFARLGVGSRAAVAAVVGRWALVEA